MKYYTNEGKTYCVVGTVEGTVTSASGVVIASFSANEQNYFTAPAGGFVTISDDTAIVTPVFDLAPSALVGKSSGGDTPTPSGGENTLQYTFAEDGTGRYTIECDLSGCTNGRYMFYNQTNLTSFSGDLSSLTDGYYMFSNCWNLTSFSSDLPALTYGYAMFQECTGLTSFSSDLHNLTNGQSMFRNCKTLTSFSSDLPNLTSGAGMFGNTTSTCTQLDLASVQHIANTINDLTDKTSDGSSGWGLFTIGISSSIQGNADLATALEAIRAKGWTVREYYKS